MSVALHFCSVYMTSIQATQYTILYKWDSEESQMSYLNIIPRVHITNKCTIKVYQSKVLYTINYTLLYLIVYSTCDFQGETMSPLPLDPCMSPRGGGVL